MPRCCGGASCACVVQEGLHIQITGTGSSADPFVIAGDVDLEVVDNPVFDLSLTGLGTEAVPWRLAVNFASTAKLNDLPDVNVPSPTNAQVLSWDTATGQWIARAPTTAAAGTVTHDTSLAGDGSAGTPLQINEDPARMLATSGSGLGLSDTGMNSIVRRFADGTARTSASPAPVTNSLSMLASNPGQIDYWNGSAWGPAGVFALAMTGNEMFVQSGAYTGAQRITFMVRNVDMITDAAGVFDAIPATDLAGKAGVITAIAQPTAYSLSALTTPYSVILAPDSGAIRGVAYRLDDGQPMAVAPISCTVVALVY